MKKDPRVTVCDHPLVQTILLEMRARETSSDRFNQLMGEVCPWLLYEATRGLSTRRQTVPTPTGEDATALVISSGVVFISILRAGIPMAEVGRRLFPGSSIRHLGLERNEQTAVAREYYQKEPPSRWQPEHCLITDPMLATGGSAARAILRVKEWGPPRHLTLVSLIAAPEGIRRIRKDHSDVQIVTGAIDRCLNGKKYILPGLGDAGDRLYNT